MNRNTIIKLLVGYFLVVGVLWTLLAILTGRPMIGMHRGAAMPFWPLYIASAAGLFGLFIQVVLGVFVYRDARERGMEPLLWAVVAALIPYFVGFVVYLVVRQTRQVTCPSCGARSRDSASCPSCGAALQTVCASCKRPVRNGGKFCPHCGAPLERTG